MKKTVLLITILILTSSIEAQFKDHTFQLSYFGHNISQPGLSIGMEIDWLSKTKTKDKKKGLKPIEKSILFIPQINFYHHVLKESNFTLGTELVFRRKNLRPKNYTHDLSFGLFYMRSFNAGKTYKVIDGEVKKIPFAGQNYFAPSLSYSLGRNFLVKKSRPLFIFIKPMVFFMMPYNNATIPNTNLKIGITYTFKNNTNA